MARAPLTEMLPESDVFGDAPHPRLCAHLFGQNVAEAALLEAYRANRLAQAWLIGGPEGIGKATLAWRFAKFVMAHPDPTSPAVQAAQDLSVDMSLPPVRRVLNMSHGDVGVLRRGWNEKTKKHFTDIRIDDVRERLELFRQAAGEGGWRVVIVDSAEDLNASSANALLKMIEEPPARSLFLILAHKPGQVLATIKSRCRRLMLEPLQPQDVEAALAQLGEGIADLPASQRQQAAAHAHGSVREALRLLDGEGLALSQHLAHVFQRLPQVDWRTVHRLADKVAGREQTHAYEALLHAVYEYLDTQVHAPDVAPARLAPYAEVWDKMAAAVRETDGLNLDRKPLIINIFSDLSAAVAEATR